MSQPPPVNLPRSLQQAFQAFGAGQTELAERLALNIVQHFPREPHAHYLLGNINHQQGDFSNARKFYKKAYKFDHNNVAALAGLGTICLDEKDYKGARQHFTNAIRLHKKPDTALFNNLGLALKGEGKIIEAIQIFEKIFKKEPQNYLANYNLGDLYAQINNPERALTHFKKAAKSDPQNPLPHIQIGIIERVHGAMDAAVDQYKKAIDLDPDNIEAIVNLGNIHIDNGHFEAAESQYRHALDLNPDNIAILIELGDLLYERNRRTEATELFTRAAKRLAAQPDWIMSNPSVCHKLGRMFERLEDYKQSFHYNKLAQDGIYATLKAANKHYKPKLIDQSAKAIIRVFSNLPCEKIKGGSDSKKPIFIVGMPRSGTSLCEQILASHPYVFGAGELRFIPELRTKITPKSKDWADYIEKLSPEYIQDMAADYLKKISALSNGEKHVIDKLPHNFQYIGLIRLLFPKAYIIHNKRHIIDNCVSIYFQSFGAEMMFDHRLEDIAHFYRFYNQVMNFWQNWDSKIISLEYEKMVSNQENETRKLLAKLGLPWNENCLRFYNTKRAVKTASRLQVRQPIYKSSIEKWRRYGTDLDPLIQGLENLF